MKSATTRSSIASNAPGASHRGRDPGPAPAPVPLRPRPRLFWGLLAAWSMWVAAMVILYALTVAPHAR